MIWRRIAPALLVVAGLLFASGARAQTIPHIDGPFPVAKQVGVNPFWGPVCSGPLGVGPCIIVQRDINYRNALSHTPIPTIVQAVSPVGPLCEGPFGNGPCEPIRQFLAVREVAKNEIVLPSLGYDDDLGELCVGPYGAGPCEAVRDYIALTVLGIPPLAVVNPRQPQMVGTGSAEVGPICNGPFGKLPCTLLAQASIDMPVALPPGFNFGIPPGLKDAALAAACAQRVGLDVSAYAVCTGKQIVLSGRDQAVLDCAVKSGDAQSFGECAAPEFGLRLSADQKILADCAARAGASMTDLTVCAGGAFGERLASSEQLKLVECAQAHGSDSRELIGCAGGIFLRPAQAAAVACASSAADAAAFATCAANSGAVSLSNDQRRLVACGAQSKGEGKAFATCLGNAALADHLGQREQDLLACAAGSSGSTVSFAACAAPGMFNAKLSREQAVALQCAAESGGNAASFGACAATNFFNLRLNPEQQIIVQCVASTGGQPYVAAGCMGSRLTARELTKCMSNGFGGKSGCFGDNNDLVGKNGWVSRTFGDLAKVPGAILVNPGLIWAGDIDFLREPGKVFGGSNSFFNKPGQIFGGPNSVFHTPGQVFDSVKNPGKALKNICGKWC